MQVRDSHTFVSITLQQYAKRRAQQYKYETGGQDGVAS
jgi:hypothetical protein